MSYQVVVVRSAEREYRRLPVEVKDRVAAALRRLPEEPRPRGVRKLAARPGWRLRVGDYRVVYTIDDEAQLVTIIAIGHRREVYRR